MSKLHGMLLAILSLLVLTGQAAEPSLQIIDGDRRVTFTSAQLLSRGDVKTITVTDSEYRETLTQFKAVPVANLFQGVSIPEDAVVQFRCTDGFAAYLEKARLLNRDTKASTAYLAIEDPRKPWPLLPGKKSSAGPFYLVWKNPEASSIGSEEWPYQVTSFEILPDLRAVFPKVFPAVNSGPRVLNGFKVFKKNCFSCHQMNGEGAGSIGPDLNRPMNPVEYFETHALRRIIRDSASVRTWPHRIMPPFSTASLSESDLDDLIAYLHHMSTQKERTAR